MDVKILVTLMADNASRIQRLVEGVSDDEARWRPAADSWSILEVVNHLLDEEKGIAIPVTASVGIAIHPDGAKAVSKLIELADNEMYAEKRMRPVIRPRREVA